MTNGFQELNIEMARQKALNIIFDEFQKTPEKGLQMQDFKSIRRNWVATFTCYDFPDLLIIVEYDGANKMTYTDLYNRRTRNSSVHREAVLFEI